MSYHYIVFLDCTEERQQIIPRTVKHRRKSLFGEKVCANTCLSSSHMSLPALSYPPHCFSCSADSHIIPSGKNILFLEEVRADLCQAWASKPFSCA